MALGQAACVFRKGLQQLLQRLIAKATNSGQEHAAFFRRQRRLHLLFEFQQPLIVNNQNIFPLEKILSQLIFQYPHIFLEPAQHPLRRKASQILFQLAFFHIRPFLRPNRRQAILHLMQEAHGLTQPQLTESAFEGMNYAK